MLAVVEASCGGKFDSGIDPAIADVSHRSGRRLHARVLEVDGVQQFIEWVDTKLGVRCAFERASDGALRCLPRTSGPVWHCPELVAAPLTAEDAACPEVFPALPNEAEYRATYASDVCSSTKTILHAGAPVTPSGRCKESPAMRPGTYELREVTRVTPSELVAATLVTEKRGALAVSVLVADDGAREVRGIVDPSAGEECAPPHGEDSGPCTSRIAYVGSELDATCARSVAVAGPVCNDRPPPRAVAHYTDCGVELLQPGRRLDVSEVHRRSRTGECGLAPMEGRAFYEVVGPLPSGVFPDVSTAWIGHGRIAVRVWATTGGERLTASGFVDTQLGEPCEGYPIEGVLRCIPSRATFAHLYADEHCTVPLVSIDDTAGGCGAKPTLALRRLDCGHAVHAVGARYDGPVFAIGSDELCARATTHPTTAYFQLGARIDPTRFAELAPRQE